MKAIITNSAPIKQSLGELPAALAARLLDSNSKLAQSALQICECIATAMGPRCKNHVRTFFPPFFQGNSDSPKSHINYPILGQTRGNTASKTLDNKLHKFAVEKQRDTRIKYIRTIYLQK